MPIIPDPNTQSWKGQFRGNYKGDFVQSFNIDLESSPGTVKASPMLQIINDRTTENFGLATNLVYSNADGTAKWYASCIEEGSTVRPMLKRNDLTTAGDFTEDDSLGAPADNAQCYDMIVHGKANGEDRLFVAHATTFSVLNTAAAANAWDANYWVSTLGQAAFLGQPVRFAKLEKVLAIVDKYLVHTIDENDVVNNSRLTFSTSLIGVTAMSSLDRFWFGFRSDIDGSGLIAEWDGFSNTYNNSFPVSSFPLLGFVVKNVPYYVLADGSIVKYNGAGFSVVQYFPFHEDKATFTGPLKTNHAAYVDGDNVLINIGAPSLTSFYKMRAGVWCFDTTNNNLYHRYAWKGYYQYGGSAGVDAGAIVPTYDSSKFVVSYKTTKQVIGTPDYVISRVYSLSNSGGQVSSYIVTPLILSNNVQDAWQNIWLKYVNLSTVYGKVIIKYRVTTPGRANLRTTFTWSGSTGGVLTAVGSSAVGTEIELLSGPSAGSSYQIATKTGATITIDETPYFAASNGETAYVLLDDWKKISDAGNPITDTTSNFKQLIIDKNSLNKGTHVQFKIEFRDSNNLIELQQIMVDSKVNVERGI